LKVLGNLEFWNSREGADPHIGFLQRSMRPSGVAAWLECVVQQQGGHIEQAPSDSFE